jgi:sugar phosphate isomerase/epimerase
MPETRIGYQLYTVRGECERDLDAAIAAIARMGYQGVEPWGYDGQESSWRGRPGTEIRRALDAAGISCCGMHITTAALQGDRLRRTVEFNGILGNRFLVIAMDEQRMKSRAGIAELAGILNGAAASVKPEGMLVGYHAHGFDFTRIDGKTAWEILFESTVPEVVMQIDNGNTLSGGGDPLAMLRKFPGRARSVHVKEYGEPAGGALGEGSVDWPLTLQVIRELHRPEWIVVEQGGVDGYGFDVPRLSLAALRSFLGKAGL